MRVHKKDSELARYFNKGPASAPKRASYLFGELVEALTSMEVAEVIEVTELPWDYQTSNLRKGLISRGVPSHCFVCRRPGLDLEGNPRSKEERPLIIIKTGDFLEEVEN